MRSTNISASLVEYSRSNSWLIYYVLLASILLGCDSGSSTKPTPKPIETGIVTGTIIDFDTKIPIVGASVTCGDISKET